MFWRPKQSLGENCVPKQELGNENESLFFFIGHWPLTTGN